MGCFGKYLMGCFGSTLVRGKPHTVHRIKVADPARCGLTWRRRGFWPGSLFVRMGDNNFQQQKQLAICKKKLELLNPQEWSFLVHFHRFFAILQAIISIILNSQSKIVKLINLLLLLCLHEFSRSHRNVEKMQH